MFLLANNLHVAINSGHRLEQNLAALTGSWVGAVKSEWEAWGGGGVGIGAAAEQSAGAPRDREPLGEVRGTCAACCRVG